MLTDAELIRVLDHYFGGPDLVRPSSYFLGLHVGESPPDLSTGDGFIEPATDDYWRIPVTDNFWAAAVIPFAGPNEGRVVKHNAEVAAFPSPSAGWGTPTHIGVFAGQVGGVPRGIAIMSAGAREVEVASIVRFIPGTLTLLGSRVGE